MKTSKLSFETKMVNIEEGCGREQYRAFLYKVDGKGFEDNDYNPADAFDVVDKEASDRSIVVLLHCGCGIWECSSIIARVSETKDGLIHWKVGHYRWDDTISEFFFRKSEYEKTMVEIHKIAEEEIKRLEQQAN